MRENNNFMLNRKALPKSIWKCEACYQESGGDELYVIDGDFRSPEAGYSKRFESDFGSAERSRSAGEGKVVAINEGELDNLPAGERIARCGNQGGPL